jgi:hypothetical protein
VTVKKKRAKKSATVPAKAAAKKRATANPKRAARPMPKPRHTPAAPKHVAPPRRLGRVTPMPEVVKGLKAARTPRPLTAFAPEERAFGAALAGASPKERVLFDLRRARAAFHAAIKGLTAASAEEPLADGRWCTREVVLHLVTRDQARLREMESALHGVPPSWKGISDAAMDAVNAEALAAIAHHGWDESLRLLELTREKLLEAVESLPDEPADTWSPEHPFGWMLHALPPHDRHHADTIKRWRTGRGA